MMRRDIEQRLARLEAIAGRRRGPTESKQDRDARVSAWLDEIKQRLASSSDPDAELDQVITEMAQAGDDRDRARAVLSVVPSL